MSRYEADIISVAVIAVSPRRETGGELTVDHFRPISAGRDDSDDNLVYACHRCNEYKGYIVPSSADTEGEVRLLHPLLDDLTSHFYEDENGLLVALSAAGLFHITVLHLNRPQLVENRLEKRGRELEREYTRLLEGVVEQLRSAVNELREMVEWQQNNED
jgi:hypothetical protein